MTDTPSTEDRRIRVDAKKFAAAWNFVSREETRYYLCGVHIEPHVNGGVLMVGTDGHTLTAIYDAEGEANGQYICPVSPALARACRSRKPHLADRDIPSDNRELAGPKHLHFIGAAAYLTGGVSVEHWASHSPTEMSSAHIHTEYMPAVDGTFPDWRRVVPQILNEVWKSEPSGFLFAANGHLIARFSDAVALLSHDRSGPPSLSFFAGTNGHQGPLMIRCGHVPEFFGLLMPMRPQITAESQPSWLANIEKENAA